MLAAAEPIATGNSYDALIEAIRARKVALGMTDGALEDLIDLSKGHVSKLLGPVRQKGMGPFTFDAMFRALAIKFVIVPDDEMAELMTRQWEVRKRPDYSHARRCASLGKSTMRRAIPVVMAELGKRGVAVRNAKMTAQQRSRSAKRAAVARWGKRRRWQGIRPKQG